MNPDIQKAFHEAVNHNDLETARRMIAAGADVNAPYDGHHYSILTACCNGNYELVRLLVESGADVNVRDNENNTPLLFAAMTGKPESVKLLIDAGAHINVHGDDSQDTAALNLYFSGKGKNLNRLAEYAMKLGVMDKLTPYLEVLA